METPSKPAPLVADTEARAPRDDERQVPEGTSEAPGCSMRSDATSGGDGDTDSPEAGSHYLAINKGHELPLGGLPLRRA